MIENKNININNNYKESTVEYQEKLDKMNIGNKQHSSKFIIKKERVQVKEINEINSSEITKKKESLNLQDEEVEENSDWKTNNKFTKFKNKSLNMNNVEPKKLELIDLEVISNNIKYEPHNSENLNDKEGIDKKNNNNHNNNFRISSFNDKEYNNGFNSNSSLVNLKNDNNNNNKSKSKSNYYNKNYNDNDETSNPTIFPQIKTLTTENKNKINNIAINHSNSDINANNKNINNDLMLKSKNQGQVSVLSLTSDFNNLDKIRQNSNFVVVLPNSDTNNNIYNIQVNNFQTPEMLKESKLGKLSNKVKKLKYDDKNNKNNNDNNYSNNLIVEENETESNVVIPDFEKHYIDNADIEYNHFNINDINEHYTGFNNKEFSNRYCKNISNNSIITTNTMVQESESRNNLIHGHGYVHSDGELDSRNNAARLVKDNKDNCNNKNIKRSYFKKNNDSISDKLNYNRNEIKHDVDNNITINNNTYNTNTILEVDRNLIDNNNSNNNINNINNKSRMKTINKTNNKANNNNNNNNNNSQEKPLNQHDSINQQNKEHGLFIHTIHTTNNNNKSNTNLNIIKQVSNNLKTCRICMETEEENNERLISPCKCIGSVKYIHLSCLKKSIESLTKMNCELCNDTYFFKVNFKKSYSKDRICRSFEIALFSSFIWAIVITVVLLLIYFIAVNVSDISDDGKSLALRIVLIVGGILILCSSIYNFLIRKYFLLIMKDWEIVEKNEFESNKRLKNNLRNLLKIKNNSSSNALNNEGLNYNSTGNINNESNNDSNRGENVDFSIDQQWKSVFNEFPNNVQMILVS